MKVENVPRKIPYKLTHVPAAWSPRTHRQGITNSQAEGIRLIFSSTLQPQVQLHKATKRKTGLLVWISRCENVQRDPPDTPTCLVSPSICFSQVAGELKSQFLPFLTFLAYRVQDCSYSGAVPRVQLDRVDSSARSYTVGSTRKSVSWSQRGDARTPFAIVARYDGIYRPIHVFPKNELILELPEHFELIGSTC